MFDTNVYAHSFSHVQLFATPWTVACQVPLPMEYSRQEYWSGLLWPPARDILNPGIEPTSLMSPALAGRFFTTSITWEALNNTYQLLIKTCADTIRHRTLKCPEFTMLYDLTSNLS